MKTNEIIRESEQLDELLGGLKGMLPGGGGYAQGEATAKAKQAADATAKRFTAQWMQMVGANPAATPDQLTNYAQSITKGGLGGPVKLPPFAGKINNASDVQKYIAQAFALSNMGAAATPEPEKPADPAQEKQPAADTSATPEQPTDAAPTAPAQKLMGKQEIMSWISRNSEDYATLKSFADGIGVAATPAAPAKAATPAAAETPASEPAAPTTAPAATTEPAGAEPQGQSLDLDAYKKRREAEKAAGVQAQQDAQAQMKQTADANAAAAQANAPATTAATPAPAPAPAATAPAIPKVGPGVVPQTTMTPSKVTYKMPAAPAKKPVAQPVAESLTWSKNFDPGQSLVKKLAPTMSSRTINKR